MIAGQTMGNPGCGIRLTAILAIYENVTIRCYCQGGVSHLTGEGAMQRLGNRVEQIANADGMLRSRC